jgi:uncharacterized membrane protein
MVFTYIAKLPFALMTFLSFLLFATTMVYWNFKPDVNFLLTKQDLVYNPVWRTAFYIHIFGGMLAIGLGPLQFIYSLRKRFLELHRVIGKLYVTSILCIAAPTGLYMAFYANGGILATFGFILMSVLWFYTTFMGIHSIRKKQIEEHKHWMIRSYAVTFSAVTLRLWVPVLSLYLNIEHLTIVILTAWISWLINLLVAECIIKFKIQSL